MKTLWTSPPLANTGTVLSIASNRDTVQLAGIYISSQHWYCTIYSQLPWNCTAGR